MIREIVDGLSDAGSEREVGARMRDAVDRIRALLRSVTVRETEQG